MADGYHALVTGAGSGIGRAIALALVQEGMHVHLVGRDATKLASVAACAGGRTSIVAADLSSTPDIARIVDTLGPSLHVLVHCAGRYARGEPGSLSAEQRAELDNVNVRAPLLLTSACLPKLRSASGQVVFLNSSASLRASPEADAYAASKRALKTAVDALRQDVNPDGIRVLSVFPGRTDTPMQRAILAMEGRTAPLGTLMRPEDVAAMVLAALKLPNSAEVTDIIMRPMRPF